MSEEGKAIVQIFLEGTGHGPCFEMEKGLEALNEISQALGYTNEGYFRGSAFENFIRDNPGCVQAILDWIAKQTDSLKDWQEKLYMEDEVEIDEEDDSSSTDPNEEMDQIKHEECIEVCL